MGVAPCRQSDLAALAQQGLHVLAGTAVQHVAPRIGPGRGSDVVTAVTFLVVRGVPPTSVVGSAVRVLQAGLSAGVEFSDLLSGFCECGHGGPLSVCVFGGRPPSCLSVL